MRLFERCGLSCAAFVALTCSAQTSWTDTITAANLRSTVVFLASPALQGRNTPSRGLEAAADYIASEFRRDGLESPPGAVDFSQIATLAMLSDSKDCQISISGRTVDGDHIAIHSFHAISLNGAPVFKWAPGVSVDQPLSGYVLILRAPSDGSILGKLEHAHPDAIVELAGKPLQHRRHELVDQGEPVVISIQERDLQAVFDRLPSGLTTARATLHIGTSTAQLFQVRNLIGVLPGSDPELNNEYVLISAHYDHLGAAQGQIFYGANDNASGVAGVLALARAFSAEPKHPKRTLVFLCFFGEEEGLLGSTWYVKHPLLPLAHTVADINFEQLGIPESSDGLPPGSLGATGYALCNLPQIMSPAIASAKVHLRNTPDNEGFFARSDNYPFARAGIPAQTFAAGYEFPDYHRPSDTWDKLDFTNEARVVRALALGIESLANTAQLPHWTESAKTSDFISARRELHD